MKVDRLTLYLCAMVLACLCAVAIMLLLFRVPSAERATTFNSEYTLVLSDYAGNQVHLYDYRRKILIAYAWASWCPYCGTEIQGLSKFKQTYGDSIQVVAVNRGESLQVAKAYTDHLGDTAGVTFLLDPEDAFFKQIGGYAMPEMVFIDSAGTIIYHQRGPIKMEDVDAEIQKLSH